MANFARNVFAPKLSIRSTPIHRDDYGVAEEDWRWICDRLKTETPRLNQIDRLERDSGLTPTERSILVGLQRAVQGNLGSHSGQLALTKGGSVDAEEPQARSLRIGRTPRGEPELVRKVRSDMLNGLWGHEEIIDSFAEATLDLLSPARLTPAVLSILGSVGHGKDEAVLHFAKVLYGEKAKPVVVDFEGKTDRDLDGIFGDDGPLGPAALKKLHDAKGGVVHLLHPDQLASRAPELCQELIRRLIAREGTPGYARVPYIFDFDQPPDRDPVECFAEAIGAGGARVSDAASAVMATLSASARFSLLAEDAMLRYAKVAVPEILHAKELGKFTVRFDDAAASLLARLVTTPHAPLYQLHHRLHRLLFRHFDTQTSLDRAEGGVIHVSINPAVLEGNEGVIRGQGESRGKGGIQSADDPFLPLVTALRTRTPNFDLAKNLFVVQLRARHVENAEERAQLIQLARSIPEAIDEAIAALLVDLPEGTLDQDVEPLLESLVELRGAVESLAHRIMKRERLRRDELLTPRELRSFLGRLDAMQPIYKTFDASVVKPNASVDGTPPIVESASDLARALIATGQVFAKLAGAPPPEFPDFDLSFEIPQIAVSRLASRYARGPSDRRDWQAHDHACVFAVFEEGGERLMTASTEMEFRRWDPNTGTPSASTNPGAPVRAISNANFGFARVVRSDDGRWMAATTIDARGLDSQTVGTVRKLRAEDAQVSGGPLKAHLGPVEAIAFSPDRDILFTGGDDKDLIRWSLVSNAGITVKPLEDAVVALACRGDRGVLAVALRNGTIELRAPVSLKALERPNGSPTLKGPSQRITCLLFQPGGNVLAAAYADSSLRLWDSESGNPIGDALEGHTGIIHAIAFSPDGKTVASVSEDRTVRFWDVETQKGIGVPVKVLDRHTPVAMTFSPGGGQLVVTDRGGKVHVLEFNSVAESLADAEGELNPEPAGEIGTDHIDTLSNQDFVTKIGVVSTEINHEAKVPKPDDPTLTGFLFAENGNYMFARLSVFLTSKPRPPEAALGMMRMFARVKELRHPCHNDVGDWVDVAGATPNTREGARVLYRLVKAVGRNPDELPEVTAMLTRHGYSDRAKGAS